MGNHSYGYASVVHACQLCDYGIAIYGNHCMMYGCVFTSKKLFMCIYTSFNCTLLIASELFYTGEIRYLGGFMH